MTIGFQEELPLDHELSLEHWAKRQADHDVETGYHSNWDYAYENAWMHLEDEYKMGDR